MMASQSGGGVCSELRARDLPSKRLLGKGLASIGYETELNKKSFARIDFIGVPSGAFQREAAVLVALQDHENVVRTHGWMVDKMLCSLVLEYMEDDLSGMLQKWKESPLVLPEALNIIMQISRGMEFLHKYGILHGDLKTKNILVMSMDDGALLAKVGDFGLVQTKRKSMSFVSRQARKLDAVQWKAPEILEVLLLEDKDETSSESDEESTVRSRGYITDLRADVYSFALICFHILTGEDPYPNMNWKLLGKKIVSDELRPQLPAECPLLLKELLASCWSKAPAQRPSFFNIFTTLEHLRNSQTWPMVQPVEPVQKIRKDDLVQRGKEISYQEPVEPEDPEEVVPVQEIQKDDLVQRGKEISYQEATGACSEEVVPVQEIQMPSSAEHYIELSRKCTAHAKKMTSTRGSTQLQFNHGQCAHLANRLEEAMKETDLHMGFHSPRRSREEAIGIFKHLYWCAKEIETFIQSCCEAKWVQAVVVLSNVYNSEHVCSLDFDLDFCLLLVRCIDYVEGVWDRLHELGVGKSKDMLNEIVARDQRDLVSRLEAMNFESSEPAAEMHQLIKYLLQRLRQQMSRTVDSKVLEIDLSSLKQVQTLGICSFGTVRKSIWLDVEVAEKTFHGSDVQPGFRNEVRILAGLTHPNIVRLLGYGMDESRCSIVMELMDGDLHWLMHERLNPSTWAPFSIAEAVDMMLQTAEGMLYLHENNVVHRDLKSSNILVKRRKDVDGEYIYLKVADFALSKTEEKGRSYSILTANMGTRRWRAPELMRESRLVREVLGDPFKVDVYSFGMVCSEILTGRIPFSSARSLIEVWKVVLEGVRPELPFDLPPDLRALIDACWHSNASQRPSFAEICKELRRLKFLFMGGSRDSIDALLMEHEEVKERERLQL